METPTPIDLAVWPRREHYEHYLRAVPCTYSMTVELDVTAFVRAMRSVPSKSYVAQIWAIANVVNTHAEFKMSVIDTGADGASDPPGVWPIVHPMFTVFNPALETFAAVWAPYDPDFGAFHERAATLLAEHSGATRFIPQGQPPANTFDISSLPWASFTGFNLNIRDSWRHLAPIFTVGGYIERQGRTLMPMSVQLHHAAADGFHAARLVNELQELFTDPSWVQ